MLKKTFLLFFFLFLYGKNTFAESKQKIICLYSTTEGKIEQVNSLEQVPSNYRNQAKCFKQNDNLAAPEEVELSGAVREEEIVSTVGKFHIRWPRKVESFFGRTPLRAMTDAANTLGRTLKSSGFPDKLQKLNIDWKVVFLDSNLSEEQIPTYLVTNCHPGWMTPPANIYIVAQRVAEGCGAAKRSLSVADSDLTEVLLHEMGHVVEYNLLNTVISNDRKRAEGFATWFANYASQYSSILSPREVSRKYFIAANKAIEKSPETFTFQGSFEDYSRASLSFFTLVEQRGLRNLMDVYRVLEGKDTKFESAVKEVLNWDENKLNKEVDEFAKKHH